MKRDGDGMARTARERTARGTVECGRGGEQGQPGKVSSCAPSTLILSGLFAWGTNPTPPDVLLF